jgi:plastocyanin
MDEEVDVSKRKLVVLSAFALMVVTGLVMASAPAIGASTTVKATGSDSWSPASKAVAKGTKVVWKNPSGDDHDVTSYKGAWSKRSGLSEGGKTSFTFRKVGTYKYRCTRHSQVSNGKCQGMCGKIQVR